MVWKAPALRSKIQQKRRLVPRRVFVGFSHSGRGLYKTPSVNPYTRRLIKLTPNEIDKTRAFILRDSLAAGHVTGSSLKEDSGEEKEEKEEVEMETHGVPVRVTGWN